MRLITSAKGDEAQKEVYVYSREDVRDYFVYLNSSLCYPAGHF